MPNHVTTRCDVTGPEDDVRRFERTHLLVKKDADTGKPHVNFDFDTVVPMSSSVKATIREMGTVGDGEVYLCAKALLENRSNFLLPYERNQWLPASIRTWGDLIKHFESRNPGAIEAGKRALRAAAETGYPGWYEWSVANWGTKWNSYAFAFNAAGPGELSFKFETAWSFPEPIFRKLAEMYPTLVFAIVSYDEGDNFACVGEFNGANDYATVDCTPELYERAYGRKQPTYDDDGNEIEVLA